MGNCQIKSKLLHIIYRVDTASELLIVALIGKRNDGEVYQQFKRKR